MSATELVREKKKRRNNQYPTLNFPSTEGYEQDPENRSEAYTIREVMMIAREKQREALDRQREQQDLLRAEMDRYYENMSTRRITSRDLKMKGDLSNMIKATLVDETITSAKGRETERKHHRILGGLYHSDHETTTEIEIHRGDAQ
jgi:polynucleotide 5'-kinase involved in rRNA processing